MSIIEVGPFYIVWTAFLFLLQVWCQKLGLFLKIFIKEYDLRGKDVLYEYIRILQARCFFLTAVIPMTYYGIKSFYFWYGFIWFTATQAYFLTGFHPIAHSLLIIFWILTDKFDSKGKCRDSVERSLKAIFKKLRLNICVEKILQLAEFMLPNKKKILTKIQRVHLQHKWKK